jgi:diguanylate cyclase (GGDEF)-like protein
VPDAAIGAAYLVLYTLLAWWGSELGDGGATTPWYPPPGLTVTLIVAFGVRFAPLAALAEGIVSIVVFDVGDEFTGLQVAVNAVVVAAAYTIGPYLLRRKAGNGPLLRRPSTHWLFVGTCVLLGPALAALGGIGVREWADATGGTGYWTSVRTWFVGDALGVVTVAPIALVLLLERVHPSRLLRPAHVVQAAVLVATAAVTVVLDGDGTPRFAYLCLIPLAWIAHHHGLVAATAATATLNVEIVLLSDATLSEPAFEELQGLVGVVAFTGLILGALASDSRRAKRLIADARARDPVTGLASRSQLLAWIGEECTPSAGRVAETALVMLDIDRFSVVNDVWGHATGDRVLAEVAERLAECVRFDGRCARFGSDEFAVLTGNPADAEDLAARLIEAIGRPFVVDGRTIGISARAGIAVRRASDGPGDLVRGACLALQRAGEDKREVVTLDDALRAQSHHRHVLESDLPNAFANGELSLVFQPILWLHDRDLEAYEALLRWNHPTYGGVPPPVVVELADQAGLATDLGRFVLTHACFQVAAWAREGRWVSVHVNTAARDLLSPGFADRAARIADAAGVDRTQVAFELTEESAIVDLGQAEAVLAELRARGFRLAIDDFGTGYASLTYLERLAADVLKLDRSFVAQLTGSSRSDAILRAIVPLAHDLGYAVVAEGVETQRELELLTALGCDAFQGYLLGYPRPGFECRPISRPARPRALGGP